MGGTNDSIILFGIILFLALTALAMPVLRDGLRIWNYNNGAMNTGSLGSATPFNINDTTMTAGSGLPSTAQNTSGVITFIVGLLFWFTGVPLWFNLIFLILRIMVVWLIVRLFRSGGG